MTWIAIKCENTARAKVVIFGQTRNEAQKIVSLQVKAAARLLQVDPQNPLQQNTPPRHSLTLRLARFF
ncbi:MAG: hypothetical protein LBG47_10925 [Prevotellaceae bacterium]|jgi:hypothetical protein|nr:hypothetical protein [Prevotellaceae bacterium]